MQGNTLTRSMLLAIALGVCLTSACSQRNQGDKSSVKRSLLTSANSLFGRWGSGHAKGSVTGASNDLEKLLTTGLSGNDNGSYWGCETQKLMSESDVLTLEFWSDSTGQVSHSDMRWSVSGPAAVDIIVEGRGVVRLFEIEFDTTSSENDLFTAVDSKGELSTCSWKGLSR